MRRYETIYIARPGSGEKEIESITERITQTITSRDGSIVSVDNWGIKKLAYPIKNEQQGYYAYIEYAGLPEAVTELERLFRIDDKIIRYITVKTQDVFSHIPSDDKPEEPEQSESLTEEASSEVTEEVTDQETSPDAPEDSAETDE